MSVAISLSACSDGSEDDDGPSGIQADAGTDTDHQMPSAEPIDFESTEPADPQRIHVESSQKRAVISDEPPLATEDFFPVEQAERLIPGTDLEAHTIFGQQSSPTHNSIRYAPLGADLDIFGAALQIWDLEGEETTPDQRHAELRQQFLNVDDDLTDAPEDAFFSRRSGIQSVVFTAEEGPYVFILSCDTDHCERQDLIEMATTIAAEH